jgi:aminoglycoside phosphotransferase (APT) family kinase protein
VSPGALIARLIAAGALDGPPAAAAALAGGYANHVWRLDAADGRRLLLKAFTGRADNPLFPNLPDHEVAALHALAGLGVAPDLVAALPASPAGPAAVLYAWVEGEPWRADPAAVARLLGRVHAAPPPAGLRALAVGPAAVAAEGDALLARASPGRRAALAGLRPAPPPDAPPAPRALVHTDCGPGNLIAGPAGLRLIDWQCPGLGDPAEDLACFLSPAIQRLSDRPPHAPDAVAAFLAAYPDPAAAARWRVQGAAFHWRIATYCLWRAEALAESRPEAARAYADALALERAFLGRRA